MENWRSQKFKIKIPVGTPKWGRKESLKSVRVEAERSKKPLLEFFPSLLRDLPGFFSFPVLKINAGISFMYNSCSVPL